MWDPFPKTKFNGGPKISEPPPGSRSEGGIWCIFAIFFEFVDVFWKFFEVLRNFQNFWKMSWNFFEFFGILWKCFGIFWNFRKIVWNFSEFFEKMFGFFLLPLPNDGARSAPVDTASTPQLQLLQGSKQRQKVPGSQLQVLRSIKNQNSIFFLIFKDFKIFIAREARPP